MSSEFCRQGCIFFMLGMYLLVVAFTFCLLTRKSNLVPERDEKFLNCLLKKSVTFNRKNLICFFVVRQNPFPVGNCFQATFIDNINKIMSINVPNLAISLTNTFFLGCSLLC